MLRGFDAHCTACGQRRSPFAGTAVNIAGRPTRFGGSVARVAGWLTLGFGFVIALLLGLVLQALFPAGYAGFVAGFTIALLALTVGVAFLLGARKLHASGTSTERDARVKALFALAAHRGGVLTARDAAGALRMPVDSADALLTELVKEAGDRVTLEVDDNGGLNYHFPESLARRDPGHSWASRLRVSRSRAAPVDVPGPQPGAHPAAMSEEESALEEMAESSPERPDLRAHPR